MDPVSTLTAVVIAHLAIKKFSESSASELSKTFTKGAISKMDALRQKIMEKLHGKSKAEQALSGIQNGSTAGLEQLTPYLHTAMDEVPEFAQDLQRSAQDILVLTRMEGRTIQNIYRGQGFQVNEPTAPVIQGGSGNTITIHYGTPSSHPLQAIGNSTPTPSQPRSNSLNPEKRAILKAHQEHLRLRKQDAERISQYEKLEEYLRHKQWLKADMATRQLIMAIMTLVNGTERCLNSQDWQSFPCDDLKYIDDLWMSYSDERFGFSAQKNIYREIANNPCVDVKPNHEIWLPFTQRVGWQTDGDWRNYTEIDTSHSFPNGSFPDFDMCRFAESWIWRFISHKALVNNQVCTAAASGV
jgi:hypothetical protein